ncbi:MAG: VWA domain-containing protein [Pseudomonadota bacterium]
MAPAPDWRIGDLQRIARVLIPYGLVLILGGLTGSLLLWSLSEIPLAAQLSCQNRGALLLLGSCALLCWLVFHRRLRRAATMVFSRVPDLARTRCGPIGWLTSVPGAVRVIAVALICIALARPQSVQREESEVEGIDLMIVLDVSKSMEETDLQRNRLDAAQRTIRRFLKGRRDDRIGLVVFAREAMLECPLTLDYAALDSVVAGVSAGSIDPMGTAIGDGLALAIASLLRSDAKSRVAILLTDGDANVASEFDPDQAKELAKREGIRVFTVLLGREAQPGDSPSVEQLTRRTYAVRPDLLQRIAAETGGRYFNAADTSALEQGFEEVRATLEKSKRRETSKIYAELYPRFAAAALFLLIFEVILSLTRLRRFP